MVSQSQKPFVLWFTGLSGAGKSTIATAVGQKISEINDRVYLLDGDGVRKGLCADLTFTDSDRDENIRRVSEVAKLMVDSGFIVLAAFITPKHSHRQQARDKFQQGGFIEVFVDTAFEECEKRDIKGLYKKARSGGIKNFTGIDSQYERPNTSEIHIKTDGINVEQCVSQIFNYLYSKEYLKHQVSKIDITSYV
ncbi:MAG: adenylyl-sulfate kinase [Crocinitomicaceae bacterium]|jgi:adenylyl-sulfate kinase